MTIFDPTLFYFILAFLLGAIVALSELLSRYSWPLSSILTSGAGLMYLLLNAIVSILAYFAAVEWNWMPALTGQYEFWRVLAVGILGMAFLRSSFANVKLGGKEVSAGLCLLITIFEKRAERALDQDVALERYGNVTQLVQGLTYRVTRNYLCAVTEGVLRSLSKVEAKTFQDDVAGIDALDVDDSTKMELFSMRIIDITGLKLFTNLAQIAKTKFSSVIETDQKISAQKLLGLKAAKKLFSE